MASLVGWVKARGLRAWCPSWSIQSRDQHPPHHHQTAPSLFFPSPPSLPLLSGRELGHSCHFTHATHPLPGMSNPQRWQSRAEDRGGAANSSLFTTSKTDLWLAHKGPLFNSLPPESQALALSGQAPDKWAFSSCLESHLPAYAPTWPPATLHMPAGRPTPRQGLQSLTEEQGTGTWSAHSPKSQHSWPLWTGGTVCCLHCTARSAMSELES